MGDGGFPSLLKLLNGVRGEAVNEPADKIRSVVAKYAGVKRVTLDLRLYHDLGLSGDDAWELMQEIAEEFGTNFSGLHFARFFPEETEAFAEHLRGLFRLRSKREPVTVGHLLHVVQEGVWRDPTAP